MSDYHFFLLLAAVTHIDYAIGKSEMMLGVSCGCLVLSFINSELIMAFMKGFFK